MGHKEILRLFFENPAQQFQIRGIAKLLKIPKTTVSYHVNIILKKGLIIKKKNNVFPVFKANETGGLYLFYKRQFFLEELMASGLVDYIEDKIHPKCIILFGSFAKAEYDTNSDIDLFVQAEESRLNLEKFRKKLKHDVNIFFEPKLQNLSAELLNNIVNGIKLRGFLKVK